MMTTLTKMLLKGPTYLYLGNSYKDIVNCDQILCFIVVLVVKVEGVRHMLTLANTEGRRGLNQPILRRTL